MTFSNRKKERQTVKERQTKRLEERVRKREKFAITFLNARFSF